MFKAFVLVRNVESRVDHLELGEFTISRVGLRFEELRTRLKSTDVNQSDWLLEKTYTEPPPGRPGSVAGGIPEDIEDILFLLRISKTGELAFVKQATVRPDGYTNVLFPYRVINDMNSYSSPPWTIEPEDCGAWAEFATAVRNSQSWGSKWFAIARRFFLSGGAKRFDPRGGDVDRVVDYATALEATLVPERDYNTRRIRMRSAALIADDDSPEKDGIVNLISKFYDIRSRIVHGSGMRDDDRTWLLSNWSEVELRVRQVVTAALRQLPRGEQERRAFLARFYDPTDFDRGETALARFREIKTAEVRRDVAATIAKIV